MALDALWMLELASQRAFLECAQPHAPTPGMPGNVEGAGFFDSLGRNAGLFERSEPTVSAGKRVRQDGRFGDAPRADLSGCEHTTAEACGSTTSERYQVGRRDQIITLSSAPSTGA